jgi:hypothetical protein
VEYNQPFPHFHGIIAVTIRYTSATLIPRAAEPDRRALAAAATPRAQPTSQIPFAAPTLAQIGVWSLIPAAAARSLRFPSDR